MRVLSLVVALVVTPLLAGVAQDKGQAATAPAEAGKCVTADEKRSASSWERILPDDPKARARVGCAPVAPTPPAPPPPPPSDPVPPPPGGTGSIDGRVYNSLTFNGLAGWVVELNGTVKASLVTDAQGRYMFSGLPAGSYTVCEAIPPGWVQTFPGKGTTCPTGWGWSFSLAEGTSGSFVNFGNAQQ